MVTIQVARSFHDHTAYYAGRKRHTVLLVAIFEYIALTTTANFVIIISEPAVPVETIHIGDILS